MAWPGCTAFIRFHVLPHRLWRMPKDPSMWTKYGRGHKGEKVEKKRKRTLLLLSSLLFSKPSPLRLLLTPYSSLMIKHHSIRMRQHNSIQLSTTQPNTFQVHHASHREFTFAFLLPPIHHISQPSAPMPSTHIQLLSEDICDHGQPVRSTQANTHQLLPASVSSRMMTHTH